jgi:hypothetical protein
MRLLFPLDDETAVSFDRFLTATFEDDAAQAAGVLNDSLERSHARFVPRGDDLILMVTEEGRLWTAENVKDDPGAVAGADQVDAELRDLPEDD